MSEKRPAADQGQLVVKRQNVGTSRALTRQGASGSGALIQTVCLTNTSGAYVVVFSHLPQAPRTSSLQAPLMELSGHSGEIFTAKFDPTGNLIASGSMDRTISTYIHLFICARTS